MAGLTWFPPVAVSADYRPPGGKKQSWAGTLPRLRRLASLSQHSPPAHPASLTLVRSARPPAFGFAVVFASAVVTHAAGRVQPVAAACLAGCPILTWSDRDRDRHKGMDEAAPRRFCRDDTNGEAKTHADRPRDHCSPGIRGMFLDAGHSRSRLAIESRRLVWTAQRRRCIDTAGDIARAAEHRSDLPRRDH